MSKRTRILFVLATLPVACRAQAPAQTAPMVQGPGCTTATVIDWDCDGYGPGSPLGPDADDNDPAVNTSASALAKYGATSALLAHLGYQPLRSLYISTTGNDSTGQPDNESLPYRSWNAVSSMIRAGDAVIWRAGTYPDHPVLYGSGTAANPIVLMAYPGEKVILDQPANGADFVAQSNIIIDGLIFTDSATGAGNGVFFGEPANNITIRNIEVYHKGRGMLGMNNLSNILIEHSSFHDTTQEHALYLGAREFPDTNVTVRYNLLYNAAYNGLQFNGRVTNLVVDSNIIHSNGLSGLSLIQGVSSSIFRNNLIYGNARNCAILFDYIDTNPLIAPYNQTNNLFVNNTCWVGSADPTGAAISQPAIVFDNEGLPVSLDNNRFENNIFVTQNYAVFRFGQAMYLNTTTVKNNILFDAGGGPYLNYNNVDYSFSSLNAWDSLKSGNVQADPLFRAAQTAWYAAPGNFDFTLQPGSPAIGLAIPADAPAADLLQAARGASPDAGAYQFGLSGSGIRILLTALPAGSVGVAYSNTLAAAGGVPPYTWTVASGGLPPGLALSAAGVLSGVPTAAASPVFTVRATDSASNTATAPLTLVISDLALVGLDCVPAGALSLTNNCTVTLAGAAPSGGTAVLLSSSAALLAVPASVTVPAGATSAAFTATAGAGIPTRGAIVTATLNGTSRSASLRFGPRPGQMF